MAYTYSDYAEGGYTVSGLSRARRFLTELNDARTAAVGDHGKNRDPTNLNEMAKEVIAWIRECEKATGVTPAAPLVLSADFRGAGGR